MSLSVRKELLLKDLVTKSDLFFSIETIELANFARTDPFLEDWSKELLTFCVTVNDREVRDEDLLAFLDEGSGSNDGEVLKEVMLSVRHTVMVEDGGGEEESLWAVLQIFVFRGKCEAGDASER